MSDDLKGEALARVRRIKKVMGIDQPNLKSIDEIVADDKCPKCGGELDTGWECNDCGFDAMPIALKGSKPCP